MKKLTVVILFLALMLGTLASCHTPTNTPTPTGTGTGEVPATPETLPAATRQLVEKTLPYTTDAEREAWLAARGLPNERLAPNLSGEVVHTYNTMYEVIDHPSVPILKTALVNNADELLAYIHDSISGAGAEKQAAAMALYNQLKETDFSQRALLMVHVNPSSYLQLSFQGLVLQEDTLIITYTSPQKDTLFAQTEERWGFVVAVNKADLPANTDALVFCQSVSFPEATDPEIAAQLKSRYGFSILKSYRFEPIV